jgi:hypothetical protein
MPSTHRSSWLYRIAVLLAAVGLLAAACGHATEKTSASPSTASSGTGGSGAPVPGVSSDEIKFSAIGTNSNNPLGTCVLDCYAAGIKAYFDYRNSQGGVDGRKLVLDGKDDQYAPAATKTNSDEALAANKYGPSRAARQRLGQPADAGIPTYVGHQPGPDDGKPQIFGNREVTCIDAPTQRRLRRLARRCQKVATLGYGVSDSSKLCAQSAAQSIKDYSSDIGGAEAVHQRRPAFGLSSGIAPEVTAMKDAGVDFIIGCTTSTA